MAVRVSSSSSAPTAPSISPLLLGALQQEGEGLSSNAHTRSHWLLVWTDMFVAVSVCVLCAVSAVSGGAAECVPSFESARLVVVDIVVLSLLFPYLFF